MSFEIVFPCGLKIKEGFLSTLETIDKNPDKALLPYIKDKGCLIHGKNCKAK